MVSVMISFAMEHVSKVWVELVLASIAAVLYLVLSAKQQAKDKSAKPKRNAKMGSCDATVDDSVSPSSANTDLPDEELTLSQQALKAMRQNRMADAISLIQRSPEAIRRVPFDLACRLLISIAKDQKLSAMGAQLKVFTGKISPQALDAAILEAMKGNDVAACRQLHILSGLLSIQKSSQTFEILARAYACAADTTALRVLVEEAGTPLPQAFAEVVLEQCARLKETRLAADILQKMSSTDASMLRGATTTEVNESSSLASICSEISDRADEANKQRPVLKEITMRANDIRSCGKNGDLKGAIKVFERLGTQANNALIFNSLLDACVECKDMQKAIEYFQQPELAEVSDVISYNTMMKGYIATGQEPLAKRLLSELSRKGLSATRTSFHGLLNARVNARDFNAAWKLVGEMQAAGISPNAVTCSILLKGKLSSLSDVSRVLALIDAMDSPMDEVLFLSVVESCIRTGRLDLLSKQTEKFLSQGAAASLTAPTYGSMIKAYGHARDLKRVWHLWDQMIEHSVQPTSVTLGCMVEALVANGRTHEAWALVQKQWKETSTRSLVNTVIYSSILKGFAQAKELDNVMALYEEMRSHDIQANTITYNTILNAFAHGGAMQRVPALLEDMKAATPPVEPDIVTYSTIVKGFCNSGNLDRALKVLEDMKDSGKHSPDEVMYNSLLGGCAKEHRPDEALLILTDMKKFNVAPSNYTLSMLVKLFGRCRRIGTAFTMLEDISQEYGLKINIQVYTCLIQGCFNANMPGKAVTLHEKILKESLSPDSMTYTVLVRGCVQGGLLDKAVELVKSAYGVGPIPTKACAGLNAGCLDEVISALGGSTSAECKELMGELGERARQPALLAGKTYPAQHNGKGAGKGYSRQQAERSCFAGRTQ